MKKPLPKIIFALLSIILIFTACTEPEEFENVLIGSWKYTDYQTGDWEKIVFHENLDYILYNFSSYSQSTSSYSGTYSYTDTTFTLERRATTNIVFKYAVSDNYLIVYPGKTYVRQ